MAAKEQRRKVLHYRKATFLQHTGRTLQQMLEEALEINKIVGNRLQNLSEADENVWVQFINTHRNIMEMEFGNLVLYAPDTNRQIITFDNQAKELDIEQISPPTSEQGKKRQFLESLLYYGIKDNHVVLLQSIALKAREFENYIN